MGGYEDKKIAACSVPLIHMIDTRIDNFPKIDIKALDKELKTGMEIFIQFNRKKYNDKMLADINKLCTKYNGNLSIRFYGHENTGFDCNTLLKIPKVKSLYIDSLYEVRNFESLKQLKNLTRLSVGIGALEEFEFLSYENLFSLKELRIADIKDNKVNLAHLANYKQLITLSVDGQTKNIATIGEITSLKVLHLRAIKNTSLDFVNKMKGLLALEILLGGRSNINEIQNSYVRRLGIDWIPGFNDISVISNLKKLASLRLSNLKQLKEINIKKTNTTLRYLTIFNCKSLTRLKGINHLKKLKELRFIDVGLPFEDFIRMPLPKTLKAVDFITLKEKKDREIQQKLKSRGYKVFEY
jgi:protein phosphatase 1 regulatory subunit 7